MESREYLLKHSQELSEEYPGKYLAIVDDSVVAVSSSGHDALEKALLTSLNISPNTQCIYYESGPRFLHIDLSHKGGIIGYIVEDIRRDMGW